MIYWLIILVIITFGSHAYDFGKSKKDNLQFLSVLLLVLPPMLWAIVKLWNV